MDTSSPPNGSYEEKDLLFMNTLNNMLIKGNTMEEIQKYVSSETRRIFSSHGATIYVVSEDKTKLILSYLDLMPDILRSVETVLRMKIPPVEIRLQAPGLYYAILQAKEPVIINDSDKISELASECTTNQNLKAFIPQIMSLTSMRSVMMVPLVYNDAPIGLLEISRGTEFTPQELSRFAIMASQVRSILVRKKEDDILKAKNVELEQMNQVMVGRELRMTELKAENERLKQQIAELTAKLNGSQNRQ